MAKKCEQQEIEREQDGYYIVTAIVTLSKGRVVKRKITSKDQGPFETREEAEIELYADA